MNFKLTNQITFLIVCNYYFESQIKASQHYFQIYSKINFDEFIIELKVERIVNIF